MAISINLLKHTAFRKCDELTQVHGSIKWCVVFADGSHQYFYKIITRSTSQYAGSGGGYMKTHTYVCLAMNTETYKYEPVKHLHFALQAAEAKHGESLWAQSQTVSQSMLDKWGCYGVFQPDTEYIQTTETGEQRKWTVIKRTGDDVMIKASDKTIIFGKTVQVCSLTNAEYIEFKSFKISAVDVHLTVQGCGNE